MDVVRRTVLAEDSDADGTGVVVAVLDTGIDVEHEDFRGRIDLERSRSFTLMNDLADRHGHGTHVAGIIGGSGTASHGRYQGIAPGVTLIVMKVVEGDEKFDINVTAAVDAAIELGVDIINYSGGQRVPFRPPWKWSFEVGPRDQAFNDAAEAGILCVAAAGNEGLWHGKVEEGSVIRPGNLPSVLCVGATVGDERVSPTSGRGPVYVDSALKRGDVEPLGLGEDRVLRRKYLKPDVVAPGGYRVKRDDRTYDLGTIPFT